jgi:hypothetical protein
MRQSLLAIVVVTCIGLSAACDNSGGGSTTAPSSGPLTTESFSGTIQPTSSDSHTFTVAQTGEIDVTLTSVGPPPTIFIGLAIGTPASDGSCTPLSGATVSTQASSVAQLSGTAAAGTFCVVVYDIGNQTAPVTYTLTVAHS